MNFSELVKLRRSVRTYTGEPLKKEQISEIQQFINQLQPVLNTQARIEILSVFAGEKPIKLGTYGKISGAKDFIALIYSEKPFAEMVAAYQFEQVVLFCTGLGLGTCWLGAAFNRKDFEKQIKLQPNEYLKIVSPVGYIAEKQRLLERIVNVDKFHYSRKDFGELFFNKNFDTALTAETAEIYAFPLEMLRLAPSGHNRQEWRVVKKNDVLHFYKTPCPPFDNIDIGIALCHFAETCKELSINGEFEFLNNFPKNEKLEYMMSWVKNN